MIKRSVFISVSLLLSSGVFCQQQNIPLNREFGLVNQKVFNSGKVKVHTAFQPLVQSWTVNSDSISGVSESEEPYYLINVTKSTKKPRKFFHWMERSLFYDNLLVVDTGNFYLTLDFPHNYEFGEDLEDDSEEQLYRNTRGILIRANVGSKFSLETSFYENQMVPPDYLSSRANASGIISGQGRWKRFKNTGFDFASSSANISYTPIERINLQLGTGKHFIGDGYRSLLLSDFSFNYPYYKITTFFGKNKQFQYTKLNATLSTITRREEGSTAEALFIRKSMSVHFLDWLVTNWLSIGVFEATLWQTEDSLGTKPYRFQQLNPIIGINTISTYNDKHDHSKVGLNNRIILPLRVTLYNQVSYHLNKNNETFGYQVGLKYFGINNLTVQGEFNKISTSFKSTESQLLSFTNYTESLGHPFFTDFKEVVGIVNYKYKRLFFEYKVVLAGEKDRQLNTLMVNQAHLGFLVNPKTNSALVVGLKNRKDKTSNVEEKTNYVYFGFRTSLRNLYDDF